MIERSCYTHYFVGAEIESPSLELQPKLGHIAEHRDKSQFKTNFTPYVPLVMTEPWPQVAGAAHSSPLFSCHAYNSLIRGGIQPNGFFERGSCRQGKCAVHQRMVQSIHLSMIYYTEY
jgi:hypothetical protein